MPEIEITAKSKVAVKYLRADIGVRYWEDATVNGVVDEDGSRIPCSNSASWMPLIDLETGVVQRWPAGTVAEIHYKVCDDGAYFLLDDEFQIVKKIDGYVPPIMCPEGGGYGDYVIMKIDGDGKIANWKVDLRAFEDGGE
jgi:hypothetical protein